MILSIITSCTVIGTVILCVYLAIKNEKLELEIQKRKTEISKLYNDIEQEFSRENRPTLKADKQTEEIITQDFGDHLIVYKRKKPSCVCQWCGNENVTLGQKCKNCGEIVK